MSPRRWRAPRRLLTESKRPHKEVVSEIIHANASPGIHTNHAAFTQVSLAVHVQTIKKIIVEANVWKINLTAPTSHIKSRREGVSVVAMTRRPQ